MEVAIERGGSVLVEDRFAPAKPECATACRISSIIISSLRRTAGPGDVHVHFFGTDCLSFSDGIALAGWRRDAGIIRRIWPPVAKSGAMEPSAAETCQRNSFGVNAAMSKQHVALLGLGFMGTGMAGRLLSADFPLTIYNRNREKAEALREVPGALIAKSPREAAARRGRHHQHGLGRCGLA